MRKLFTRLISIFILSSVIVLQGFAQTFPVLGPDSDFTNHKKSDTFVLTASEAVTPGVGVVRLLDGSATLAAYQATSPKVSIAETADETYEITIDFTSFLEEGTTYTLEVDANFVKSVEDGTPSDDTSWAVEVGDFTAPELADSDALSPANGAVSVQLDAHLTATFNEDIWTTLNGQVYIYTDNGTPHGDLYDVVDALHMTSGTMEYAPGLYVEDNVLTIVPNKEFKELTKYYVVIPDSAVTDATSNENAFAGWVDNTTWVFTTRDATAPEITESMADNITKDAFDVVLQLDKPGKVYVYAVAKDDPAPDVSTVIGSGVSEEVAAANTNVTVSLDGFTEGDSYDVYVVTENAETVDPTVSEALLTESLTAVTTADETDPAIATDGLYPADGETAADVNEKDYLTMKFTEDIMIGTGSVDIYTWDAALNHELFVSVPVASCMVSEDSLFIPVDKSTWVSSATYFVEYNAGIVVDGAGNKLAALENTEDWKFTVKDFVAPTYTIVPTDGTRDASEDAPQITITFSEKVYEEGGSAYNSLSIFNAIVLQRGSSAVGSFSSSFDGMELEITILDGVASRDTFIVTIDTKKIFDASGNGGSSEDVIEFTIRDFEGPAVTIEPMSPGESDNILVKFDEPVFNADGTAVTDADVANMVIFRKGNDAAGAIVAATYTVAEDGMSFIIDPTNDFTTPEQEYYVSLGAGAVKDEAGNANTFADAVLTISDFIAPTATIEGIGTSPVDPTGLVPVITFSEAMATLDGTAVAAFDDATSLINLKEDGDNIEFTAAWTSETEIGITATFDYNKTYTISVGKSLEDLSENPFEGVSTTFTTWSDEGPEMVTVSPEDESTEQANDVSLEVTFDQDIALTGAGSITIVGTAAAIGTVEIDGAVLKIGHTDFSENENISVTVSADYVEGMNGFSPASDIVWSFSTEDTQAPAVDVYSPADDDTDVALDSKLKLTFNENIVLKTGQILIKDAGNDVTVQTLTEANAEVIDDNELEISLVADLDYNKEYYVVITEGLVEDAIGNKYAGITNPATWSFTTIENPGAFMVESSVPADMEDKVAAGINPITFTFNRAIKAGSLSETEKITITNVTDGVVVLEDVANSGRFSISGSTLSINALEDIVADKEYSVALAQDVVADEWGTGNTASSITFYTYDNYGPKVVSHTPETDATKVPVNTTIVITWDEAPLWSGNPVSAAGIKSNALVTIDGGVNTNYTALVNDLTWTLTLDAPLAEKTVYTVTVAQDLVEDELSNSQVANYSWQFTTEDVTAPEISAFNITDNTQGTEVSFTIDLNEAGMIYYMVAGADDAEPSVAEIMAANSIEFYALGTSVEHTVTDLVSGGAYTAYFVAVDTSNNQSAVVDEDFTTVDVIAPMVTSMVPANGAMDIDADTELTLVFDETVSIGGGHVIIREVATDIIVDDFDIDGSNTTIGSEGNTVIIEKTNALGSKTAYYVEVTAGTFVDAAGNPMAAITGVDTWSFTTKDTDAPMLESTSPDYNAAETPEITADEMLSMEFNETMKVGAGVVYVKYADGPEADDVFDVINADELSLSDDMKTITFGLNNVPVEQAEFYMDLSNIALTDTSDNAWDGMPLTSGEWNFIILDQTPPALASSVPVDGETGFEIDQDIVLTFTESIYNSDKSEFNGTDAYIGDKILVKDENGATVALDTVTIDATYKTVTITPEEDLTSETTYTVYISPVIDNRSNISDELTVTFTTKDMTAPFVTMWDPEYLTMFNPKTGVVTVTFSEPIYDDVVETEEGNYVVVDILDENIVDFFNYNMVTDTTQNSDGTLNTYTKGDAVEFTGTISDDKMVITLTPVDDELPLTSDEGYVVELKAEVVEDDAENPNDFDYNIFGIEDYVAPMATMYTPWGPTMADEEMTIKFDEDIAIGEGNVYIRNYDNGEVVETIAIDETTTSVEDSMATIAHADFPEAMDFYVTADEGVFTDATPNANAWEGIAQDSINTWRFSTADAVAPGVIAEGGLFPVPGSTNIPMNTPIEITFDKKIELNDDGETRWIVIYNEDWTPYQVIEVNSSNIDLNAVTDPYYELGRVVSVKHMNLEENSTYYVRVMEGAIVDLAGNSFVGISDDSWSFTTEDNEAPTIVNVTPEDDASGVSVNPILTIEFDRGVMGNAAGMIGVYKEEPGVEIGTLIETIDPTSAAVSIEGAIATITLSQTLEANTGYYVIVESGSFTNLATSKKPLDPGITTTQEWNFTTGEAIVVPELVEWTPQNTIADNHPTFVMTFADDVMLAVDSVGYLTVTEKDSTEATLKIEITADMIAGNVVTVNYDTLIGRLNINTTYIVNVDGGILENAEGNTFEGVSADAWTFTTGPDWATANEPQLELVDFNVYPNPFNNQIMIDNNDKLTRVVIVNIAGQRVMDMEYPGHVINTSNLVSGVYVVSMFTEDGIAKTEKITKR